MSTGARPSSPSSPARSALVEALAPFTARINLDDVCQRGPDTFGFTAADKSGFGMLSIEAAPRSFTRTVIVQSLDPAAIQAVRGDSVATRKRTNRAGCPARSVRPSGGD